MRFIKHDDGVGPNHLFQGDAHCVGKVESCGGHDFLDEMRQHLGVGVAGQRVPTVREELFERLVVLDDAVVNDRDFSLAARVRVGVSVAWGPVCRPTGVSDAHGAGGNVLSHMGFKVGDFAFLFLHTKLSPFFQSGDSGAVVPPVFESGQSVNQDRVGRFRPQIANDSAHDVVKFLR